jgi:hypothetical protein
VVVRGDYALVGIEYFETYSPVAKLESVRLVLALIITHKLIPLQADIGNAYIWSDLEEAIYLRNIPGQSIPQGFCYRLLKSLYGLKQSGRNWNKLISSFLISIKFIALREDLCIFVLFIDGKLVAIIAIYVDDLLLGFDSIERRDWFIALLSARFTTKVIGLPTSLLGLSLKWTPIPGELFYSSVKLINYKSITALVDYFDLTSAKPVDLPYNSYAELSRSQCPTELQKSDPTLQKMQSDYRMAVGTFIWLQVTTRVDILSILLILSQFVSNPAWQHYQAALWLIKYLKGTIDLGITYSIDNDFNLTGYVDADHASHEDRRSRYCYIFMIAGGPISWKNGFETRFTLSTAESEIRAIFGLREAIKHVLYLKKVFTSFAHIDTASSASIAMTALPQIIFEDNAAAIRYAFNPASESTMKYLEVDILWIHEAIERKEFTLVKIDTEKQLADIGTKLHRAAVFFCLRRNLMS